MAGRDVTKLSDAELEALASGKVSQPSPMPTPRPTVSHDFSGVSDAELMAVASGKAKITTPSIGDIAVDIAKKVPQQIGAGLSAVGEQYEKYITGPTRAAIMAKVEGKPAFEAAKAAFGETPSPAVSGEAQAKRLGVTDKKFIDTLPPILQKIVANPISPSAYALSLIKDVPMSKLAGFGIEVAEDPTNLIPATVAAKGALKGGAKLAAGTVRLAGKAADAVTGTKLAGSVAEGGLGAIKGTLEGLSSTFKADRASDFPKLVKIAADNGIDPAILPPAIEFGENSPITRGLRSKAEGPQGQKLLDQHVAAQDAVRDAIETKIRKIGNGHAPMSEKQAGDLIVAGFEDGLQRQFSQFDITHDKIMKQYAPGLMIDKVEAAKLDKTLNGLEKFAIGLERRGIGKVEKEVGSTLLDAVNGLRNSNGSYKQMVDAQRRLGRIAFNPRNPYEFMPEDIQKLRDLYGKIGDALTETVRKHVSPEMADELIANNKAMSELFGQKSKLAPVIGSKGAAPEEIFRRLIKNGDSRDVEALSKFLSPEQMNELKATFVDSLIKRDAQEGFSFKNLHNALRSKKNQADFLFKDAEGDIQGLRDLLALGDRMGEPILSMSGTGGGNKFADIKGSVMRGIYNESILNQMVKNAREGVPLPTPRPNIPVPGTSFTLPTPPTILNATRPEQAAKAAQIFEIMGGSPNKVAEGNNRSIANKKK